MEDSPWRKITRLKIPSWSSPPFYAKQRSLSTKKQMDIKVDYAQLPARLWRISKFLAPAVYERTNLNNLGEEQAPLRQ